VRIGVIIKRQKAVTRFELLASIVLAFILVAVGVWVLDPIGRLKLKRDSQRLSDLVLLKDAIDNTGTVLGSTHGVPVSSVSVGSTRAVDGSGWLPVDVSDQLKELPVDPLNGKTFVDVCGNSVVAEYQFISDGYKYVLRTHLEGAENRDYYANDGNDNGWYEVGDAPGLSAYFGL